MVPVGLTLLEPLAAVDVNVPGVMAILAAPAVAQLSVLLAPAFMLVGAAEKEVIAGLEPSPEDELDTPPQLTSPTQANRIKTRAQRTGCKESSSQDLSVLLQDGLVESICQRSMLLATPVNAARWAGRTQSIASTVVTCSSLWS